MKGCIVTIDAMGCQKEIARKIVADEADYMLAVKSNQGELNHNVAVVRHMAASMLKRDKTTKTGIEAKRKRAGWDHSYLVKVLSA